MSTASDIIKRCGGPRVIAGWLGMDRSGVQRWVYDPPRGCGNRIPEKHWEPLIAKAAANGHTVTVDELIPAGLARAPKPRRATALDKAA